MDETKRIKKLKVRGYKDPWANLAAAVLHGGVAAHDELFLKSNWCSTLVDLVSLASEMEDSCVSIGDGDGVHAATEQKRRAVHGGAE